MSTDIYCYLSEVGHNNFYYPTSKKAVIKSGSLYEVMPWVCSNNNLKAIKIKNKSILFLTLLPNSVKFSKDNYSIVWVDKNNLPLSSAG